MRWVWSMGLFFSSTKTNHKYNKYVIDFVVLEAKYETNKAFIVTNANVEGSLELLVCKFRSIGYVTRRNRRTDSRGGFP